MWAVVTLLITHSLSTGARFIGRIKQQPFTHAAKHNSDGDLETVRLKVREDLKVLIIYFETVHVTTGRFLLRKFKRSPSDEPSRGAL